MYSGFFSHRQLLTLCILIFFHLQIFYSILAKPQKRRPIISGRSCASRDDDGCSLN
jgi:hypothetical protein